jgi:hypothetical protein
MIIKVSASVWNMFLEAILTNPVLMNGLTVHTTRGTGVMVQLWAL